MDDPRVHRVTLDNGAVIAFPRPQICDECLRGAVAPRNMGERLLVAFCLHTGTGGVYLNLPERGRAYWTLMGPFATREDFHDQVLDAQEAATLLHQAGNVL